MGKTTETDRFQKIVLRISKSAGIMKHMTLQFLCPSQMATLALINKRMNQTLDSNSQKYGEFNFLTAFNFSLVANK